MSGVCCHPVSEDEALAYDEEYDGYICGRPAVDKLIWYDGSYSELCAIHIDEWILT